MFTKNENLWMAYPVLIFALIMCFVPTIREHNRVFDERAEIEFAAIPLVSEAELNSRLDQMKINRDAPASDDPAEYFRILAFSYETYDLIQKFVRHNQETRYRSLGATFSVVGRMAVVMEKYSQKHGQAPFAPELRESILGEKSHLKASFDGEGPDLTKAHELFKKGFWYSIFVMAALSAVRARMRGLSVVTEIVCLRLPAYAVVWFATVWWYPSKIVRADQLKTALRIIGYAMSAMVSIIPVTGMVKAADKTSTKRDESSLEYRGFLQNRYNSDAKQQYEWLAARVNLKFNFDQAYTLGSEFELVGAGDSGSNWLREFWFQHNAGDFSFKAGRIFLGAGGSSLPPYKLKTVNGPYSPYNFYGYGAQTSIKLSNNLSATIDITGKSGVAFDSQENWDSLETSGRLKFTFNGWSVNPAWQVGDGFARASIDGTYQINSGLELSGVVYGARTDGEKEKSGHALLSWRPKKLFELHTQIQGRDNGPTTLTSGLNLFFGKGISLTVDHEKALNQDHNDSLLGRVQIVF